MDPTVCDPVQKALIQQHYGCDLADEPSNVLEHLVERFRSLGNAAFRLKRYKGRLVHRRYERNQASTKATLSLTIFDVQKQ